eukprot:5608399-Prymnesium_polylepis.1
MSEAEQMPFIPKPSAPVVQVSSPSSVLVSWDPPGPVLACQIATYQIDVIKQSEKKDAASGQLDEGQRDDAGSKRSLFLLSTRSSLLDLAKRTTRFTNLILHELESGESYAFRVRADFVTEKASDNSEWSDPSSLIVLPKLGRPSQPEVQAVSPSRIAIRWRPPNSDDVVGCDLTHYQLQWKLVGAAWRTVANFTIPPEKTTLEVDPQHPGWPSEADTGAAFAYRMRAAA